jgi:hypothetical protein
MRLQMLALVASAGFFATMLFSAINADLPNIPR